MLNGKVLFSAFVPVLALLGSVASAQIIQLDELPSDNGRRSVRPATPEPDPQPQFNERQWTVPEAEMASEPALPRDILLPLRPRNPQGSDTAGHRLQGEYPQEGFWLFLPRQPGEATLNISTLSSINLLPERSSAEVFVNGTEIGAIPLENFSAAGTASLTVPSGLLRAGRNLVELRLTQTHRVFCGPEASFGVWTDVITHQSGITVRRSDLGLDPLGFIAATAAQLGEGKDLSLANANQRQVLSASPSVARVESLFGGLPPKLLFEDYYSVEDRTPQLARVTALPDTLRLPELPAFRRGGDGAIVLLTNSGEAEKVEQLLTGALGQWQGDSGLPELVPGGRRSLAEMGISQLEGRGQYIREAVRFELPWNWLLLASQRAELRLEYAFDEGLPDGALLLVKVNGQTVRLLPLDDEEQAGRRLDPLQIMFAANLLQPGANDVTFEALIPGAPPDSACIVRPRPVFEVFDSTTLRVPESPRMTLPRIDRALASVDVNKITMSAAAQRTLPVGILAQISAIFAPELSEEPSPGHPPRNGSIKIGIPSDLATIPGDIVSKNVLRLEEVLLSPPANAGQGVDPWATVETTSWWTVLLDRERVAESLRSLRGKAISLWRGPESDLDSWLEERSAEAMLVQPSMETPQDLWLVVRPNADHERLIASLFDLRGESNMHNGQVSLYGFDGNWQVWQSANRPINLHEQVSLSNARAVAGNYVTLSPGRYIAPLFLLAMGCALSAMGLLIAGRRRKR